MLSEKQLRLYFLMLILLIVTILTCLTDIRLFNPFAFIKNCFLFSLVTVMLTCASGMFFMLYSTKYIDYTRLRVKNVFNYYLDRGICFADPFFLASIAAVSLTVVLKDPQPLIGVPPIYLLVTVRLNFERTDRSVPPINLQLKDYLIRQKDAVIRKIKNAQ